MLAKLSAPIFASLLLSTTTQAAPTRTHCRCNIVADDTPALATYTPLTAHWSPSNPSPSSSAANDICASLGPELEKFQHTKPDLYESYIRKSQLGSPSDEEIPIPTTVLLDFAGRKGDGDQESKNAPRPHQKIICYSELDTFSAYQSSFLGLWALQIVIVVSILACLAEGVHLGMRWMAQREKKQQTQKYQQQPSERSRLRLAGAEQRLLAIPPAYLNDSIFSPGAEKKIRAYESTRYFLKQSPSGHREFIAYEDEDDDEADRPVM
ncbi:hypothetical protein EJ02DRAFT_139939 [Clathrospora elynae]|uniref:Uncharacterized protein n=1 Tax=Clathrospora elynae TaxID=706981 RepID=A0A6A5T3X5_9PLEO|nr:hypothetical protein EJ02DRAFT_139939 [Clathrospora elynae]